MTLAVQLYHIRHVYELLCKQKKQEMWSINWHIFMLSRKTKIHPHNWATIEFWFFSWLLFFLLPQIAQFWFGIWKICRTPRTGKRFAWMLSTIMCTSWCGVPTRRRFSALKRWKMRSKLIELRRKTACLRATRRVSHSHEHTITTTSSAWILRAMESSSCRRATEPRSSYGTFAETSWSAWTPFSWQTMPPRSHHAVVTSPHQVSRQTWNCGKWNSAKPEATKRQRELLNWLVTTRAFGISLSITMHRIWLRFAKMELSSCSISRVRLRKISLSKSNLKVLLFYSWLCSRWISEMSSHRSIWRQISCTTDCAFQFGSSHRDRRRRKRSNFLRLDRWFGC